MNFLSNGDFNFPFEWPTYWVKHFYSWSFQTGSLNPDGIIRFPGRICNFIVFALFGHIAVGYFYLFSTLLIAFLAFYYFCRKFLDIQRRSVCFIGALFFTFNPVFLGNLAKVGLVLAAAMLPLCLIAIQAAFKHKRWRYLLWVVLCLNISLIHPYTFSVNFAVSAMYFAYLAWHTRPVVAKAWPKLAVLGAVAVALNAYLILPIANVGTVSKDAISSNVTPIHADYTALVSFSNTGDLLTGLSLSKNVFLDFSFYNDAYRIPYLVGSFTLYIVLIVLYLLVGSRLRPVEKRQFTIFSGAFLLLVLLATVNFLHFDRLIKVLIYLPGGWAFRSPLKWQLYIPLALFSSLALLLNRVSSRGWRTTAQSVLTLSLVLMSGFVGIDIYKMLLTPRHLTAFAALQNAKLDQKTLLFVNNKDCQELMPYNSKTVTELNQVFTSKDVQVKRVWEDNLDTINVGSYDYVMLCKGQTTPQLKSLYGFKLADDFIGGSLQLYTNQHSSPAVYTLANMFSLTSPSGVAQKSNFVTSDLKVPFVFLPAGKDNPPTSSLTDVFETIDKQSIKPGQITSVLRELSDKQILYLRAGNSPTYYATQDQKVSFSSSPLPGMRQLAPKNAASAVELKNASSLTASYQDSHFNYRNLAQNASLESGLWRKKVDDCFAYDNQPAISMRLSTADKTDGHQSLQLEAASHIACTGPAGIDVKPGERYLIDFDYRSLDGDSAGYYVGYDGSNQPVLNERLQVVDSGWHHFSKVVTVPEGAHKLRLLLYGYPKDGVKTVVTRYDAVGVFNVPDVQNKFYLVGRPSTRMQQPKKIDFTLANPTKKVVRVYGATKPFYLATNDSYHKQWQLQFADNQSRPWSLTKSALAGTQHVAINGTMNGWFINPEQLCAQKKAECTQQADGSYDLSLVITFVPQQWFYAGLLLSGTTLLGCLGYLAVSSKRIHIWRAKP